MSTPPASLSPTAHTVLGIALAAALVVVIAWGVRDMVKSRTSLFLLLLASSLVGAFSEAVCDLLLGIAHHPPEGSTVVYSAFGRDIAPWVFLAWALFVTGMGSLAIRAADRGWSPRRFWGMYAGCVALDFIFETVIIQFGAYSYTGNQPPGFLGLPFVWPFNSQACLLATGLIIRFMHLRLPGWRKLALLPLSGGVMAAFPVLTAWPTILARGAGLPAPWTTLLGLFSAIMTIGSLGVIYRVCTSSATPGTERETAAPEYAQKVT